MSEKVTVTDIKMPFWSMVIFMVKWAIASIPALILLFFLGSFLVAILARIPEPPAFKKPKAAPTEAKPVPVPIPRSPAHISPQIQFPREMIVLKQDADCLVEPAFEQVRYTYFDKGATVNVISQDGEWYEVQKWNYTCWVHQKDLQPLPGD